MFKNYQELFLGYAEFYGNSLFGNKQLDTSRPIHHLICDENSTYVSRTPIEETIASKNPAIGAKTSQAWTSLRNYLVDSESHFSSPRSPVVGSRFIEEDGTEIVVGSFNDLQYVDFIWILISFGIFVQAKRQLSRALRDSTYLKSLELKTKDRERLDESLWRFIFYTFSSTWLVYTCFLKHQAHLLFSPEQRVARYSFKIDTDEYIIMIIEAAFYLHATYAIIFEDVRRKDTPMMLIHHLAAIISVISIYATRTHKIGLAAVVLRDTCDVLLEVTKLGMCLKVQKGKTIEAIEYSIKLFFFVFTIAFVVNQLYFYPLFCLYHAFNIIKMYQLKSPLITWILTCGLIFLVLDVLWFLATVE